MRTSTKLKVVAFTVFVGIPMIIGAGYVKKKADAAYSRDVAQQREEWQARFESSFALARGEAAPTEVSVKTADVLADPVLPILQQAMGPAIKRNAGDFSSVKVDEESRLCLANMIYGEARDEPRIGQIAVGLVALERLKADRDDFGHTVCDVVLKYSKESDRWQFDGMKTLPSIKDPDERRALIRSMHLAASLLRGEYSFMPRMKGTYYFYATNPKAYKNPKGAGKRWQLHCTTLTAVIQGHVFGKEAAGKPECKRLMASKAKKIRVARAKKRHRHHIRVAKKKRPEVVTVAFTQR